MYMYPQQAFHTDCRAFCLLVSNNKDVVCFRFKATALRQNAWKSWFEEQMKLANASPDKGLYVGLRLDGRVRASGVGSPPYQRFVKELAPMSGALPLDSTTTQHLLI